MTTTFDPNRDILCGTPDCNNLAGTMDGPIWTFICPSCINDLDAWLAKVQPMRAELFTTMARLDNVRPAKTGGGTTSSTDAPSPIREHCADMRHALLRFTWRTAAEYATEEFAGHYLPMLIEMLDRAEQMIDLPPDETVIYGKCDHQGCQTELKAPISDDTLTCPGCWTEYTRHELNLKAKKQLREVSKPMTAEAVATWLGRLVGIQFHAHDIWNWRRRQGLEAVEVDGKPKFLAEDVLDAFQRRQNNVTRKRQKVVARTATNP